MKFVKPAIVAFALCAAPAFANDGVVEGATVTGPEGNTVGTIVEVADGQTVLDTGKHKIPLAVDMYGVGEAGPTITVTKVALDDMVDQQLAQAAAARDAALVEGAAIMTADQQPLGSVTAIEGDNIVIARGGDATNKVTLPREYIATSDGGLMARLTMAQIDEASAGSAE